MTSRGRWLALFGLCMIGCGPSVDAGEDGGSGEGGSASTGGLSASSTDPGTASTSAATSSTAESSSTSSSSSSSSSTTDGDALPPECSCTDVVDDAFGCSDTSDSICDGELICPTLTVSCPRPNPDMYECSSEYVYDEAALACALAALRDRTPGRFLIDAENGICGLEGCGRDQSEITVTGDGRAVVMACSADPLGEGSNNTTVSMLADAAYFTACIEVGTPAEQYDCLLAGLGEPVDAC